MALLQSATLPRCLSAGRSRSSDNFVQYSTGYGSDELAKWKASSSSSSRNTKKAIPDYRKSHDLMAKELEFRKKHNLTTTARPFHFSTDNLISTDKVGKSNKKKNFLANGSLFYRSSHSDLTALMHQRSQLHSALSKHLAISFYRLRPDCVHPINDQDPVSSLTHYNPSLHRCSLLVARIKLRFFGER